MSWMLCYVSAVWIIKFVANIYVKYLGDLNSLDKWETTNIIHYNFYYTAQRGAGNNQDVVKPVR